MPLKSTDKCSLLICSSVRTQRAFFDLLEQMKCTVSEAASLEDLLSQTREAEFVLLEHRDGYPDIPPKPYAIYLPDSVIGERRTAIKAYINTLLNVDGDNPDLFSRKSSYTTLAEIEQIHIVNMLNRCGWNCKTAAKRLGINRTTLYRKMKKYGIKRK
jgi:DNA-binding protein Fis